MPDELGAVLCLKLWGGGLRTKELPAYDDRKALLARDPLACVEGFRVLVYLALRRLFGLRFCPRCPDCAQSDTPCMDAFGSNAVSVGGIFGRVDAVYGALEYQKGGPLHIHAQVFVQCHHQFTPISELLGLKMEQQLEMLRKYSDYTAHVRRMVYCDPLAWKGEQEQLEEEWPEYRTSPIMVSRPAYQADIALEPLGWKKAYLEGDVEALQKRKQHHVHLPTGPNGEREPLSHCRDSKDKTKCKAGFPRDRWLTDEVLLICPGLADDMGMPSKGKRNMTGLLVGPVNDPSLNGTHPALLAGLRCNSDVQLPYRFPISPGLHSEWCGGECDQKMLVYDATKATQISQAAQAGYAADYQNKRPPIARQEAAWRLHMLVIDRVVIRNCFIMNRFDSTQPTNMCVFVAWVLCQIGEWVKAQGSLIEEVKDKKPGYVGARLAKRMVTDCYARGVVRGAVEATNLTLHAGHPDPTRAEAVKTAQVAEIALQHALNLLKAVQTGDRWPGEPQRKVADTRSDSHRVVMDCPFWTNYGGRGRHSEVHMLSAYEFVRHYHFKFARRPLTTGRYLKHLEDPTLYHAGLTERGAKKLAAKNLDLLAGVDYKIREEGGAGWLPLGEGEYVDPRYRHDWVVALRKRPYVPVIYGAQGARSEDEQAARLLVLFFPWVNDRRDATPAVPFIGDFWATGVQSWRQALLRRAFLFEFPTEEAKRLVLNFCFVYFLPRSLQAQEGLEPNSDNEDLEDAAVAFDEHDLLEATLTHVRGKRKSPESENTLPESEDDDGNGGGGGTMLYDLTMQMFHISSSIWLTEGRGASRNTIAREAWEEMERTSGAVQDHEAVLRAAAASARPKSVEAGLDGGGRLPGSGTGVLSPSTVAREPVTLAMLRSWMDSENVSGRLNAKQRDFLELVVDRIAVEIGVLQVTEAVRKNEDPLVWLLHGPPGTGKSHVLHYVRKLLDDVLGYRYGLDYEVVAFQAVNAMDLGGKTIHSAMGFNRMKDNEAGSDDAVKRMAFWRWLVIDEISLTSADLLARAEERMRACVPVASPWKQDSSGKVRPFAGVNVIFTGDFQQLKPPGGAYLAEVPRSFLMPCMSPDKMRVSEVDALAEQGRMLLWGGVTQGVTELVERERCKDEWWNEVVDQLRAVRLSKKNWQYLHGIKPEGCTLSEEERLSRRRVLTSFDDERMQEEKFREAPVIVANNDARYQINKDRARSYSMASGSPLRWAVASDRATTPALQVEACDKEAKIRLEPVFLFLSSLLFCLLYCVNAEVSKLCLVLFLGGFNIMIGIRVNFVACCRWPWG